MKNPLIVLASVMTAMIVTLGLWFAPTHGQANEELAQLVDVRVVDDAGDPVTGAGIALQRMNGTDGVGTRRGGATDLSGEQSIEMPVRQGRYRIVLTVPQGYSEDRDDVDDTAPGPNGECAGMAKRCVLLDVDTMGTVSVVSPIRGADPTSVTFHVRRDRIPTLLTVTQKDLAGNAVYGGTVTIQPYTIVQVNGQNVRQWGRVSRTGMTTSTRTFRVQPFTSYVVRWEPPQGWLKVSPGAPLFGYEFTTGAKGTTSFDFVVRRPAAPGETGAQLDGSAPATGNSTGTTPPVTEPTPGSGSTPPAEPQQPQSPQSPQSPSGGSTGAVIPEPTPQESVAVSNEPVTPEPDHTVDTPAEPAEPVEVVTEIVIEPTDEPSVDELVLESEDPELDAELQAELEATAAAELEAQLAAEAEAAAVAEWLAEVEAATEYVDTDGDLDVATAIVDPELAEEWALEFGLVVDA